VWHTRAMTNAAGEATLDFAMPDNLTTWKLQSWVMGPQTQVGEASVEVITRKDLMVRLQSPRFFTVGDEATISGIVHNETDAPMQVQSELTVGGGSVQLAPGPTASQSQSIAAHGEHRFDWRVKAAHVGNATFTLKAIAATASDAMQQTFPVQERGVFVTQSRSLSLRADQPSGTMQLYVPEERQIDSAKLVVRYSPTLAMALIEALPFLSDYPHGCAEQTLNRFVPTVITLGMLKDLGVNLADAKAALADRKDGRWLHVKAVFDETEVRKRAHTGLQKLLAMQAQERVSHRRTSPRWWCTA
jgi:alpha-2-macroglobulin